MLDRRSNRWFVDNTLHEIRRGYRDIAVVYPTEETVCTECGGQEEFTQSAFDAFCTTCNGTGYTFTWATVLISGRIQHYDFVKLSQAGLPPGIEIGDAVIYVSVAAKEAIEEVRGSPYGYVYIDGQTYRPWSIEPTGVMYADDWRVELKRSEVKAHASGY